MRDISGYSNTWVRCVETMNEECRMTQEIYQIRVRGRLDKSRAEWFEEWTIAPEKDGTTVLTGQVVETSLLCTECLSRYATLTCL